MNRGMSKEDATLVIETMAKYKDFFVDTMMQQELELQVSDGFTTKYCIFLLLVTRPRLNDTVCGKQLGSRRRSCTRESA